jgi:hypothetical protein
VQISDTKKQKHLQSLKFRIATFYNNSSGRAKHSTNGRAIKGIKERLTGKEGLLRSNLLGKRCEVCYLLLFIYLMLLLSMFYYLVLIFNYIIIIISKQLEP